MSSVQGRNGGPLVPATRSAAVAEELRRQILAGELPPGTRLRQVEIAELFNVSTTPVREAFSALAEEGLVRKDPQRGVVVFAPTVEDLLENYEIRLALEPLATELAALSITEEEMAHIDDLLARMRRTKRRLDYQRLNREFHRRIYSASGRPRLLELIESLRDASEAYIAIDAARPDPDYVSDVHAQHEAIAEALRDGAAKKAGRLMHEHLSANARHIEGTVGLAVASRG